MLVSTAAAACWWRRDNWGNHAFGYERHWHNRRGNAGDRTAPLSFLSRVSTLLRDIDIAILSVVRPSVRDVPVLDENGLIYCHSFFHHTVDQSF